jgi:hypothetical protein
MKSTSFERKQKTCLHKEFLLIRNIIFRMVVFYFISLSFVYGQKQEGTMAFTISMEQPNTHYYHVVLHCEGIKAEILDFKMPAWTPRVLLDHGFCKERV